jgi:alpha-glucoside transport system substrate-binding protein
MRTLALAVVVLLGLQGCAITQPSAGTVTVLGLWSGAEQQSFEKVLAVFEAEENIDVQYVGTRAIGQVLQSEVRKGTPPDIAILPTPGEFATFVRERYLQPLDDVTGRQPDEYSQQWRDLESAGTSNRFAVTVKADLKSAVWYNRARPPSPQPSTFEQLRQLGASWCLGLSAPPDSGWPGSDWIEDILLHQSGSEAYEKWASGKTSWTAEPVIRAWRTWGELLDQQNAPSALLTEFPEAGRPMFTQNGCQLDHQPSFVVGTYESHGHAAGKDFDFFPFPRFASADQPAAALVSADLAGMFNRTPEAGKLMRFLASARAQSIWPQEGSAFSVNRKVDPSVYKDDVRKRIAARLTSDEKLCFDASDLMPPTLRTTFYRAVLEYVNDRSQLDRLLQTLDSARRAADPDDWLALPCGR